MQTKNTEEKVLTFKNTYKKIRGILYKKKDETLFFVGFSPWKRCFKKYFSGYNLIFIPKNISSLKFNKKFINDILINKARCQIFIWGFKAPDFIHHFITKHQIPAKYVEDGFVRSIQLGSNKAPPMSLCIDSQTPYFNAKQCSDLENLLNNYDFNINPMILQEAKKGIQLLCQTGISKYNHTAPIFATDLYQKKDRKRILILGQVDDDASIIYGCSRQLANNDVVRLAFKENPSAQIIYKPHPDILSGNRPNQSNYEEIKNICTVFTQDIPLANALETVDHVYTITSLAGFEALLRGIKVTTLGCPFYSGWGLTDDREFNARRIRRLTIEQLFAITYLIYPKYFDPKNGQEISFFDVIKILKIKKSECMDYGVSSL